VRTTFDVRIWKTDQYVGAKTTTYWVRWKVEDRRWKEPFKTSTLAESFLSGLVTAQRSGEAFYVETGRPVSWARVTEVVTWYEAMTAYIDMKWSGAAGTYRRTIAEAMTAATPVMLKPASRGRQTTRPTDKQVRSALNRWICNTRLRNPDALTNVDGGGDVRSLPPASLADVVRWIERNTRPLAWAAEPEAARALLKAVTTRLDGKPAARSVARQRRMILLNALDYFVERNWLETNPVRPLKWSAPRPVRAIDRRAVANPIQARTLLLAVREVKRSGERLAACYGAMYYAALRPEEAVNLNKKHLTLPAPTWNDETNEWEYGWGDIYVEQATPHAGKAWTDSGAARDRRQLKHREVGEGRHAPCPPELAKMLWEHIERFGTDDDGHLFRGERGGEVPLITWNRVWNAARAAAFTPEVVASPLARTPYDLRHAAVSTWLNGGVKPTQVAEWAGHSLQVMYEVYAKCLDGEAELSRRQVEAALRRA
jgi:integrase